MRKIAQSIPVNNFDDEHQTGISIERISFKDSFSFEVREQAHRHDRHSFFLLENGAVSIEIDFQKYDIVPSSIIYMHPNQVHRITKFENVTVVSWIISNENLNPEYLRLLEDITPAKPMELSKESFSIISEGISLCMMLSERKGDKLHHSLMRDSCNTLIGLVISQYVEQSKSADPFSRFEIVTQTFRRMLESNYTISKRPAEYAQKLNISTSYLNECVKNTTGHSVSYHIHQRIILEAKRLLYHSGRSVKEIAAELGYDDCPYFSRLFTKIAGMTALAFRKKNLD